jgi:hypothetical protein
MGPARRLVNLHAEQRRQGVDFDIAWPECVTLAIAEAGRDAGGWLEALEDTRHGWEAAYDRRTASRRERALSLVGDNTDRESLIGCERCGARLPPPGRAGPPFKFCSATCRRAAHRERAAVACSDRAPNRAPNHRDAPQLSATRRT